MGEPPRGGKSQPASHPVSDIGNAAKKLADDIGITPIWDTFTEGLSRAKATIESWLASIKELVNDAPVVPLTQQLASERDHFVRNLHHANAGAGIQAFLAKQPPKYS